MRETKLEEPAAIAANAPAYKPAAWQEYTLDELGHWVRLFVKRAGMRADAAKRAKDLDDAQNYLSMMQAHIDAARA